MAKGTMPPPKAVGTERPRRFTGTRTADGRDSERELPLPPPADAPATGAFHPSSDTNREMLMQEGLDLLASGNYDEATRRFHAVAARDPRNRLHRAYMHYARGLAHEARGQIDNARRELERALRLQPDFDLARRAADRLRPTGLRRWFSRFRRD